MTRRLVCAVTVAAVVGMFAAAAPAQASGTSGYCPTANGVTVVVDFKELGGGVVIRCAAGAQSSGEAALEHAGFAVTGTTRYGKAFVCRINGKPGADSESCVNTPPTTAYWSYWYASNGGSWMYSNLGATARTPPLGSFEGWAFSLNHTENSAPRPGAAPVRPSAPGGGGGPGGGGPGGGGAPAPAKTPPAQPKPAPPVANPAPASGTPRSAEPALTASGAVALPLAPAAPSISDGPATPTLKPAAATKFIGGLFGTIGGAVLIAALVVGAALTVVRRRRRDLDAGG